MIKALIVDDEEMARESLSYLIRKVDNIEVVESFESAIDAKKYLEKNQADVIFLDVEMPDFSGMEFLASMDALPSIILTTNNPEYAVEAFEYEVLDFIPKPVSYGRLVKAVERLDSTVEKRDDFFVRSEGRYVRVPFESLMYVETMDDYLKLHLEDKSKCIVHSTLTKMEEKLPAAQFQKVHRSYIVNLSKIVDIEETTIVVGQSVIPVSRAFRPVLKERLNLGG
ncbi:LytR/AlgR family response regulator transcription factor [Owenweeksia hongkongensis]|uniref:LytR/AlgR family response regulator transcription factor n=1 Tax=Owenweeksia hongkongensis TaxID=253245 RepID=UPI003A950952